MSIARTPEKKKEEEFDVKLLDGADQEPIR